MSDEKKPAERVIAAIDSEPWLITEEGLAKIREIASRENLIITADDLVKIEERREALAAKKAAKMDGAEAVNKRDGVAIIDVNGPISRYMDMFTSISGGTSTETLATDFNLAMDDPSVSSVLFHFDSPGGEAKGINEFANMIAGRRGEKPIAGYISGNAGSAAYWIAAAVDPGLLGIDATGFAGSVGAVVSLRKDKPSEKDRSVTFEFISKQSPKKRLDPETEAGRSDLQRRADALGGAFVDGVAALRGITPDKVLSDFGGGSMLMGQEAVDAGLVDQVTSMEAMIRTLRERRQGKFTDRSPRFAANIGGKMTTTAPAIDFAAQLETERQKNATLAAELIAEKKERLKAETERHRTEANAKVDTLERDGKLSGNATTAFRKIYVAVACGETISTADLDSMAATLPKINTNRTAANADKDASSRTIVSGVTLEDFDKAGTDVAASKRIAVAVNERRKANPKFNASMLRSEMRAAAGR
jgi:capsid assembly protease